MAFYDPKNPIANQKMGKRGILLLMRNQQLLIEGIGYANEGVLVILQHERIDEREDMCIPIVRYVERTRETVVLDDATQHIEHGGFIDKYIGDAIMALFPGQVDKALEAAIAMQHELMIKNTERAKENKVLIRMGIGINYGNILL